VRETLAHQVDGPSHVDIHDKVEIIKTERVSVTVENLTVQLSESIL
jgi:hypothetical protein